MKGKLLESTLFLNVCFCLLLFFSSSGNKTHRIGYWLTDVKLRLYGFDHFVATCRKAGLELIQIDLGKDLEEQGPFDVILHDVNDLITQQNYTTTVRQIALLQSYYDDHPEISMLDPLENIKKIQQRIAIFDLVKNCTSSLGSIFDVPPYVEFATKDVNTNRQLMEEHGIGFPFVCKPSVAHGTDFCHKMQVIFNDAGLNDVKAPCVAQTFIDHNAVLYKVYVIDDHFFFVERPSLRNLTQSQIKTIHFHSHSVSKPNSSSHLNQIDQDLTSSIRLEYSKLEILVENMQRHLGLAFFGFDIIVESNTGKYFVIDINPFPTYEGITEFNGLLLRLLQKTVKNKQRTYLDKILYS